MFDRQTELGPIVNNVELKAREEAAGVEDGCSTQHF